MSQKSKTFVKTKPEQRQQENKLERDQQTETANSHDQQSNDASTLFIEEQLECFADLLIDELLKQAL
ncbi:MAG: hypothetical protein EON98_12610 [Chitinophagaceae bacterium]|nr:MAG: hypothetical protein EON98_12610 [Chitinophagaceae bacterium]